MPNASRLRVMRFGPDDRRRYKMVHQALVAAPIATPRADLIPLGHLLAALQSIGERSERGGLLFPGAEPFDVYEMAPEGGDVTIDESQYGILKRHWSATLERFPKQWALDTAAADAWLEALPLAEG